MVVLGRHREQLARWGLVVAAAAGLLVVGSPAAACGCGAFVSEEEVAVTTETVLIEWDGEDQAVTMMLDVDSSAAEAAFVMPVPGETELALADPALFTTLAEETAPEPVTAWSFRPSLAWLFGDEPDELIMGGAESVEVFEQRDLGPFETVQLGGDPDAVVDWLEAEGFRVSPQLVDDLAQYSEDSDIGWRFVAAQLRAEEAEALAGELQPLRLSFATDEVVYPMRLSRGATLPQQLELYVAAPHRLDPSELPADGLHPELRYAGWVTEGSSLASMANVGGAFLTRWEVRIDEPSTIERDLVLARGPAGADDAEFHPTYVADTRDLGGLTLAALVLLPVGFVGFRRARRRRSQHAPVGASLGGTAPG